MRLFFALYPKTNIRRALISAQLALATRLPRSTHPVTAVASADFHLTLFFFGEVSKKQCALIEQAGNSLTPPQISFELAAATYWKEPGILCLVPTHPPDTLISWVDQLRKKMRTLLSLPSEKMPYRPHVTLFRRVKRNSAFTSTHTKTVLWSADQFSLMESKRISNAPRCYHLLRTWPPNSRVKT